MTTEDYIQNLNSEIGSEVKKSVEYFIDLFYDDLPISDKDYVNVIKTIVDKLMDKKDKSDKTELFEIVSSSLYTDNPKGYVGEKAFYEAIAYMVKTDDPLFGFILEPFSQHVRLGPLVIGYLKRIETST